MNARQRLSKLSALSFSMPDVTEAGYSPSPGYYSPAQEIVEERDERDEEDEHTDGDKGSGVLEPEREGNEHWMDATDPASGSVFYVDSTPLPRPLPNGSAIPPSTSSSSLSSSTTSFTHPPFPSLTPLPEPSSYSTSLPPTPNDAFYSPAFPPPHSSTPQYSRSVYSTSDMTHSTLPSPTHSESIDGLFASARFVEETLPEHPSPSPSPCPSEGWIPKSHSTSSVRSMRRSVRKGLRRFVRRRGGRKTGHSRGLIPSDSVPNLTYEVDYESSCRDPDSESPPRSLPPHGALYGSREFPLANDTHASIITIRISLKPHPLTGRTHRHWNLEKLGIIPARALGGRRYRSFTNLNFGFKSHSPSDSSSSPTNSLVIRGVLPATPASLTSPQLQPGDTVLAVNGHSVSLDNANSVIRSHSAEDELVLIVKKAARHFSSSLLTSTPAHHHLHTSSHHGNLARLVARKQSSSHRHHSPLQLVLYLTLNTREDDPPDKDILYCFPTEIRDEGGEGEGEGGVVQLLVKLRGVFLTLSDVMASITTVNKCCSTVLAMNHLFHLAHIQHGKEVLLLALPASVLPRPLLMATAERLESTLCLLYGSLQRAFSSPEHHSDVDHLLTLLLHHPSPHSHPHLSHLLLHCPLTVSPVTGLTAVPRNVFSVESAVRVSEALDVLEAASPTHHLTDIAHSPRTLVPHGSFLFHRGRLVQSHLPPSELRDVVTFCLAYRLLEVSAQDPPASIVIWRQIHLEHSVGQDSSLKPDGQVFLLLVGLDHTLVGLVVEGCGLESETTPTLDATYVSEAKQLIAKLEVQDLFNSTTTRGEGFIPAMMSLDRTLTAHLSTPHRSPDPRRLSLQQLNTSITGIQAPTPGSESDDEGESRGLGPRAMTLPSLRRSRDKKKQPTREPTPFPLTSLTIRPNYMLTAGINNILLHYLCLEAGQGVWLSPTHNTASPYGTLHSEMIICFQSTCAAIREILLAESNNEESDSECDWGSEEEEEEEEGETAPPTSFSRPLPGGRCVEHGVLLEVPLKHFVTEKQLKTTPPLCYWVVGRLFPETDRELYVCYEESVSQNMAELAFKMLFATNN